MVRNNIKRTEKKNKKKHWFLLSKFTKVGKNVSRKLTMVWKKLVYSKILAN